MTGRQRARRDKLVVDHLGLVRHIAREVKDRLPPCFELDDLISVGTEAMLKLAPDYEPKRGVSFGIFARKRIKGAMLESVRRKNWDRQTQPPLLEEHDFIVDDRGGQAAIEQGIDRRQRAELVRAAIEALPRREGLVIELHYGQGLELQAIAHEHVEVGAARVSQIHTSGLRELRRQLHLRGYFREAA